MKVAQFFEPKPFDLPEIKNTRAVIGGNQPPGPLEMAGEVITALSDWMKEHPVIQTEEDARAAKPFIDRAKAAQFEIEALRTEAVRPLNERVAEINAEHKAIHNTDPKKPGRLDRVFNELKARVQKFLQAEEQRRLREAAEARRAQEEAERIAREAEAAERAAQEEAAAGALDVDISAATQQADESFATFERASRFADRAERDAKVKIGGGFGQTVSLRTGETLTLDDPLKAIAIMGVSEKLREAILSAAREYRKAKGSLPEGVTSTKERKL